MEDEPNFSSSGWMGNFAQHCRAILGTVDRLLCRYPKPRHKSSPSQAERILSSTLLQLHGLEACLNSSEQQQFLDLESALQHRCNLLHRQRILPCPALYKLRNQCRRLIGILPTEPTEWAAPSVLVGSLRNPSQLDVCLGCGFYHVPACQIPEDRLPISYVAIYQSRSLFPEDCGIFFYGQVKKYTLVPRWQITEIPKNSDELYYRLEVVRWEQLEPPIGVREVPFTHLFTNLFLLTHSRETPELSLKTPMQYRYYQALSAATKVGNGTVFRHPCGRVRLKKGLFQVRRHGRTVAAFCVEDFRQTPSAIFNQLMAVLEKPPASSRTHQR